MKYLVAVGSPKHRRVDNIRMILRQWGEKMCSGFDWLRIGISGGLL